MSCLGIISDTHGLLRPEAVEALSDCERIIHAGDVGKPEVLDELAKIAPVTAVRGNIDRREPLCNLPLTEVVEWRGFCFYVLHIREELDLDPVAAGFEVVVFGHSHQPLVEKKGPTLFLNPGSAGPRRFSLPVTLAIARIKGQELDIELVNLNPP